MPGMAASLSMPARSKEEYSHLMSQELANDAPHWGESESALFIDYGHYFVPEREEQIETICDLIPALDGPGHIVEIGCGQGLLARALLTRFSQARVHGLDGSPLMLERAKETVSEHVERFEPQLFELTANDWRTFPWPVHAIVSSLVIHHLDDGQKRQLYKELAGALMPGGAIVIADLVQPKSELGNRVAAKSWDRAVHRRSLDLTGNLEAYNFFLKEEWNFYTFPDTEVDKPSSLYDQLRWLDEAGLVDVDVHWMKAGHAIFSARRPA